MGAHATIIASLWLLLLIVPLRVGASGTVINEVLFDPLGADTGLERIELYNGGASSDDLSGWELYPDGVGYVVFPRHFSLGARGLLTVHLREVGVDTESDLYIASSTMKTNMGNTSGSAALFSAEPRGKDTIKSFVQWGKGGETWESAAVEAGLWSRGSFVASGEAAEGGSAALKEDGVTGGGSGAWEIALSPTIGRLNKGGAAVVAQLSSAASSTETILSGATGAGGEVRSIPLIPTIKAYAGPDQNTIAGSIISLLGYGIGLTDKPIEAARFLWNFGDGESAEGRAIEHIFRFPGTYSVGLHVVSGEYAASDYATVAVAPNKLRIAEVVSGEDGFIRLENPLGVAVDVGGWRLEGGAASFVLSPRTRIAPHAMVALPNQTTRVALAVSASSSEIVLRYANGLLADSFSAGVYDKTLLAENKSAAHSAASLLSGIAIAPFVTSRASGVDVPVVGKEITRSVAVKGVASSAPTSLVNREDDQEAYLSAHAASLGSGLYENNGVVRDIAKPWMFFAAAGIIALGAAFTYLFLKLKGQV